MNRFTSWLNAEYAYLKVRERLIMIGAAFVLYAVLKLLIG